MSNHGNLVRIVVCSKANQNIRELIELPGDFHRNCFSMEFFDEQGDLDRFLDKFIFIGKRNGGFFCDYHARNENEKSFIMYNLGGKTHRYDFEPFAELSEFDDVNSMEELMASEGFGLHQKMKQMDVEDLVNVILRKNYSLNNLEKRRLVECGVVVNGNTTIHFDEQGMYKIRKKINNANEYFKGISVNDIEDDEVKCLLSYSDIIQSKYRVIDFTNHYTLVEFEFTLPMNLPLSNHEIYNWSFSNRIEDTLCGRVNDQLLCFVPPTGYIQSKCEENMLASFVPSSQDSTIQLRFHWITDEEVDDSSNSKIMQTLWESADNFSIDDKKVRMIKINMLIQKIFSFQIRVKNLTALFDVIVEEIDAVDEEKLNRSIVSFIQNMDYKTI